MGKRLVLIRGVNVGGKNPVPMAGLRALLEELGCTEATTYLASGNAIVEGGGTGLQAAIERELPRRFKLHDESVKVLVITAAKLHAVIDKRPKGFGNRPDEFYSDVIFMLGLRVSDAMKLADPREGVDAVWPGDGVIYWQRLTAQRTKTRLSKLLSTEQYKSMTIRSWATTTKLAELLQ